MMSGAVPRTSLTILITMVLSVFILSLDLDQALYFIIDNYEGDGQLQILYSWAAIK